MATGAPPQDFGYNDTQHAGGAAAGEAGGYIERGTAAWDADPSIGTLDLTADSLTVTGRMMIEKRGNPSFGYFNAATWPAETFPANAIMFRIDDNRVEMRWQGNGDSSRVDVGLVEYGVAFTFSLTYDPAGNGGNGTVAMSLDGAAPVTLNLNAGVNSAIQLAISACSRWASPTATKPTSGSMT